MIIYTKFNYKDVQKKTKIIGSTQSFEQYEHLNSTLTWVGELLAKKAFVDNITKILNSNYRQSTIIQSAKYVTIVNWLEGNCGWEI